ncbi:hypothetical protein [Streptomyces sp. N2A]|uniref:hypothetical protein n=1 Tax=Streptomyces sp. N2A TaxID=3073936 RepID=UPI00287083C0|nr:hypothetical protein [Streptomyces sp. N2A]
MVMRKVMRNYAAAAREDVATRARRMFDVRQTILIVGWMSNRLGGEIGEIQWDVNERRKEAGRPW